MRNEIIKAIEALMIEINDSTKPTPYLNGYKSALAELVMKLDLQEKVKVELWED
jgi:hypothetical protein